MYPFNSAYTHLVVPSSTRHQRFSLCAGVKGACTNWGTISLAPHSTEEHKKEPDYDKPRDSFLLWTGILGLQSCSCPLCTSTTRTDFRRTFAGVPTLEKHRPTAEADTNAIPVLPVTNCHLKMSDVPPNELHTPSGASDPLEVPCFSAQVGEWPCPPRRGLPRPLPSRQLQPALASVTHSGQQSQGWG